MIFRWALRYLLVHKRFVILFTLNLSLGLMGFLTLESFRSSLQDVLQSNSKNFLSADLSISARRPLTDLEITNARILIGNDREESRLQEFFSMISTPQGSRLVQIKAVQQNYPFYGSMTLGSGRVISSGSPQEIQKEPAIWVYGELLAQLGIQVGDTVRLGEASYRVSDTVLDDSTQTFRLSSIAPKVYVGFEQIKKSALVQKGTTFTDVMLFKLPQNVDGPDLKKRLFKSIPDPAVQVMEHREAGEDAVRPLAYLSDYLGLVSLVALFLSLVGSAFLYRSFFSKQIQVIAVYNVLGLSLSRIMQILICQVLILGLLSFVFSTLGLIVLFPALRVALQLVSPIEVPLALSLRVLAVALGLSTVGAVAISGFYFIGLLKLKPSELFQEQFRGQLKIGRLALIYLIFPILLFMSLAVYQAHSWKIGLLFCGLFSASVVFILTFNYFVLFALGGLLRRSVWILKHAGLQLQRKRRQNLSSAMALSLGAMLMTLLPQLKGSIQNDLATPQGSALPAFFMFDIQDEQLGGIKKILDEKGYTDLQFSPLVRARILKVNDRPFEKFVDESKVKTREDEAEARSRNRGYNLSYRDKLDKSETIVEGKLWSESFVAGPSKVPEVSVETRFAERMSLRVGDLLKFDVQGIEIDGRVTSLRSVQWNSFKPNFFISFQPGVLEEAPKSWLVALPARAEGQNTEIQNIITAEFPNVSSIDVSRTVTKVLGIVERMSWSLESMALLCFLTGFFVLYSVVSQQVNESRWDLNLQKILGASFLQSASQVWLQYSALGFVASLIGSIVSIAVSYFLATKLFEIPLSVDLGPIAWTVFGTSIIAFTVSFLASWRLVRQKPLLVLQG